MDDIIEMRRLCAVGNMNAKQIAELYGLTEGAASQIICLRTFTNIKSEHDEIPMVRRSKFGNQHSQRKIVQLSMDGEELIAEYDSLLEAGIAIGNRKGANNIGTVCKGRAKSAYGFKWMYANEDYAQEQSD